MGWDGIRKSQAGSGWRGGSLRGTLWHSPSKKSPWSWLLFQGNTPLTTNTSETSWDHHTGNWNMLDQLYRQQGGGGVKNIHIWPVCFPRRKWDRHTGSQFLKMWTVPSRHHSGAPVIRATPLVCPLIKKSHIYISVFTGTLPCGVGWQRLSSF